jgi:hypothetical protein
MTNPAGGSAGEGGQTPQRRPSAYLTPRRRPQLRPYNPARTREVVRAALAVALVGAVIAISVGLILLTAFNKLSMNETKDLALAVLAPLLAVSATVFGFYYGGHREE